LPPSYVPIILSELTDWMTFMDRVKNMLHVLCFDFWLQIFDDKKWNQFYSEVLGKLWIFNFYWRWEWEHKSDDEMKV
jgi:glucuronosyltransferase